MSDERPCAESLSAPGTEPTPPSDGQGPTLSEIQALLQVVAQQAQTISLLVEHNQELMDRLLHEQEDAEEEEGHGVDMAGKRIRVS